jgi:hypothetical protein
VDNAENAQIEGKARDLDERRDVGAIAVVEDEAFASNLHARRELYVKALEVDLTMEMSAEFTDDPLAGAIVNVAGAEINEEHEAGAEAEQDSDEIGPNAKLTLV